MSPAIPSPQFLRDVLSLSKPRVTALVLATTAGGIWLAPASLTPFAILLTLVATAMTVGAANTLNCYLEREVDGRMTRTRTRPLPAGRLPAGVALWTGLALAVVSVPILTFAVNPVTGALGALALVSYVVLYTPMKLVSPLALFVGAIPGAIPPLLGYTAATGRLDALGVSLFGILFLWQIPHFIAIGLYRKDDYANAGFRILPVVYGERAARWHALVWSLALASASLAPYALGATGIAYLVTAVVLGVGFVGAAVAGFRKTADRRWARAFFLYSIVYLTVLFAVLMVDAR
jgi:protoheme IX farnesyltransferase